MDFKKILNDSLMGEIYFNNTDLRMNRKFGYLLSNKDLNGYIKYKEECINELRMDLNLKSFNSNKMYYYTSNELYGALDDYFNYFFNDLLSNNNIINRNHKEIVISRLASELDGTLKIEGVYTTRKKILDIVNNSIEKLDSNDNIIKNMYEGYKFIIDKPEFNKENLFKLYNILSKDSLREEDKLTDSYYRKDMVTIGGYNGCDIDKIDECMNSLFEFVNKKINNEKDNIYSYILLPFIVHYYILYIHPYNDYNGRTARMVSLWISVLSPLSMVMPLFISEAINDQKNHYYHAIEDTRNSNNDLSYFLKFNIKLANKYYLVYKNIDVIKENIDKAGEGLTSTELYYLKRIIINKNKGWFSYKGFIQFCNIDITKQGALKFLNRFYKLNLLETKINSRKEKIFKLRDDLLTYDLVDYDMY